MANDVSIRSGRHGATGRTELRNGEQSAGHSGLLTMCCSRRSRHVRQRCRLALQLVGVPEAPLNAVPLNAAWERYPGMILFTERIGDNAEMRNLRVEKKYRPPRRLPRRPAVPPRTGRNMNYIWNYAREILAEMGFKICFLFNWS